MEQNANNDANVVNSMKAITILSYIGSGFWALMAIIGMVASGWIMSLLGMGMSQATSRMGAMEGMEGVDQAKMAEATEAVGGAMAMGTGIFIAMFGFILLLQILCFMGVSKMNKLKKGGFWMYAVANGIFAILMIFGGLPGIITSLVCILFIVLFGMKLKNMR